MISEADKVSDSKTEVYETYQELLGKLKATQKMTRFDEEREELQNKKQALERERAEYETRMRHLEEREAAFDVCSREMQEELRISMDNERCHIEQEMNIKFEYEIMLIEKNRESERDAFKQRIAELEAKIEHLESRNYSFNKLSFNSMPIDSIDW